MTDGDRDLEQRIRAAFGANADDVIQIARAYATALEDAVVAAKKK